MLCIVATTLITSFGSVDEPPKLTILNSKSSVILTDSEGNTHLYNVNTSPKQWEIREISTTVFEVRNK